MPNVQHPDDIRTWDDLQTYFRHLVSVRDERNDAILNAFIAACRNGGPFSLYELVKLGSCGVWPKAMRRVVELGFVPPETREAFMAVFAGNGLERVLGHGGDRHLWFKALRILLPTYDGPARTLFRGQRRDRRPGQYWTSSTYLAQAHALMLGSNGVVLTVTAPAEAIIWECDVPLHFADEFDEFIVDPHGLPVAQWT